MHSMLSVLHVGHACHVVSATGYSCCYAWKLLTQSLRLPVMLMRTLVPNCWAHVVSTACPVQGANMDDREREAIANLQHLTNLKLLHPPRSREQIQRWQAMLSEAVALLKLLSAAKTIPSNTPDAAAAVVRAQGLSAAASQAKPDGLLHGVPQDDRKRREVWRELSSHVHRLLVLLDKEVGVLPVTSLAASSWPSSACCLAAG